MQDNQNELYREICKAFVATFNSMESTNPSQRYEILRNIPRYTINPGVATNARDYIDSSIHYPDVINQVSQSLSPEAAVFFNKMCTQVINRMQNIQNGRS
jgi:hypothetical protein